MTPKVNSVSRPFLAAILSLVVFHPAVVSANSAKFASSDFPECLRYRAHAEICSRSALNQQWNCYPNMVDVKLDPECLKWDQVHVATFCSQWTDGRRVYASGSNVGPVDQTDVAGPRMNLPNTFQCLRGPFHFAIGTVW